MPAQSGNKRNYDGSVKRWNNSRKGFQSNRGRQAAPLLSNFPAPLMNPWENGIAPGMQSGFGQGGFRNQDSFFGNSNFGGSQFSGSNYTPFSAKSRLFDRVGGYDDSRGRGLLPSPPNAPLLGAVPPIFPSPQARGSDMLQQRLGLPWNNSSFESSGLRRIGSNSGYYPTNRSYSDSSRKFVKARRPAGKSALSRVGKSDHKNKPKGAQAKVDNNNKSRDESPSKPDRSEEEKAKKEEEGDEEDTKDEEKEEETEEGKEKKEETQVEFPCEALFCHICEVGNFATKKGYIRHLQAITHARMSELFHAKNAATLELLNISAKLSEMRQKDKVLRRTGKKGQPVMKTAEQNLVQKILKPGSCCGSKIQSPFEMEEHKLSIYHLKEKYFRSLRTENPTEENKPEEEDSAMEDASSVKVPEEVGDDDVDFFLSLIEKAQEKGETSTFSTEDMPVYNPSTMIGLDLIRKEIMFRCEVCQRGQRFKSVKQHCQSPFHYNNIVALVNKTEDDKREAIRLAEEEEEEKKKKEEAEEKEKVKEGESEEAMETETADDNVGQDDNGDQAHHEDDDEVITFGEEEERILNQEDEQDAADIFEEVGDNLGAQGEDDDEDDQQEEDEDDDDDDEEEEEEEEEEVQYSRRSTRRSSSSSTPRGRGRRSN